MKLLSPGSTNAKLAKNKINSYILYLSPFTGNSMGINVCPMASPECSLVCLNTAGRGVFSNVQKSRIAKTEFMLKDRISFYKKLSNELIAIDRKGEKTSIRLNGTSDLDHLSMLRTFANYDFTQATNLIFYDYTKVPSRLKKYKGSKYHLTFSLSEINFSDAVNALSDGYNVAAVFHESLPIEFMGHKVINGDLNDQRFDDPKNVVVGLKAKGKARTGEFKFVVSSAKLQVN